MSSLSRLPHELLYKIFGYLPREKLKELTSESSVFHDLAGPHLFRQVWLSLDCDDDQLPDIEAWFCQKNNNSIHKHAIHLRLSEHSPMNPLPEVPIPSRNYIRPDDLFDLYPQRVLYETSLDNAILQRALTLREIRFLGGRLPEDYDSQIEKGENELIKTLVPRLEKLSIYACDLRTCFLAHKLLIDRGQDLTYLHIAIGEDRKLVEQGVDRVNNATDNRRAAAQFLQTLLSKKRRESRAIRLRPEVLNLVQQALTQDICQLLRTHIDSSRLKHLTLMHCHISAVSIDQPAFLKAESVRIEGCYFVEGPEILPKMLDLCRLNSLELRHCRRDLLLAFAEAFEKRVIVLKRLLVDGDPVLDASDFEEDTSDADELNKLLTSFRGLEELVVQDVHPPLMRRWLGGEGFHNHKNSLKSLALPKVPQREGVLRKLLECPGLERLALPLHPSSSDELLDNLVEMATRGGRELFTQSWTGQGIELPPDSFPLLRGHPKVKTLVILNSYEFMLAHFRQFIGDQRDGWKEQYYRHFFERWFMRELALRFPGLKVVIFRSSDKAKFYSPYCDWRAYGIDTVLGVTEARNERFIRRICPHEVAAYDTETAASFPSPCYYYKPGCPCFKVFPTDSKVAKQWKRTDGVTAEKHFLREHSRRHPEYMTEDAIVPEPWPERNLFGDMPFDHGVFDDTAEQRGLLDLRRWFAEDIDSVRGPIFRFL